MAEMENGEVEPLNPLFEALSLYRRKNYEDCVKICTELLKEGFNKQVWALKLRALTAMVMVDDLETEEESWGELLLDDNALAETAPRPGTSLRTPATTRTPALSPAIRPVSQSGRPLSGVVRPLTSTDKPGTAEQALKTPRTGRRTSRPLTSASGGHTRLATAALMAKEEGGQFLDISRLDLAKYASDSSVAKPLFLYIWYHERDARHALELAAHATQACQFEDWWWKHQLGKCYFRFGMYRDAEKQFRSALSQQPMVESYLWLSKIYLRLDQPLSAIELLRSGLQQFPQDTLLLTHLARIYERLNDLNEATHLYREVLQQDSMHIEAIACIAMNHFYTDQPELALRFYRRILQMGILTAELYTNIGMCCFYAQQWDMAVTCLERALVLASDECLPDIWYNIAHIMVGSGEIELAMYCLRLAIVYDNNHAEAYNNLGVLEMHQGNATMAQSFFQAAQTISSTYLFEPHYNYALCSEKIGNLQDSYKSVKKALDIFPDHIESKELFARVRRHFTSF